MSIVNQLSQQEFERLLHAGHGRAALYVQQHGLTDVFDSVLDACLHDRIYDSQVNGFTGKWLFAMVQNSAEFTQIRAAVLEALATATDERDLEQLFQFSAEIALTGDQAAYTAVQLRALAIAQSNADIYISTGQEAYVAIGGLAAAVELATAYGTRLADATVEGGDFGGFGSCDLLFEDDEIDAALIQKLPALAQTSDALADYQRYRQWGDAPSESGRARIKHYENAAFRRQKMETLFSFENKRELGYPSWRVTLGKNVTGAELQEIYDQLLSTSSMEMRKRLLWVFRRRALPQVDPRIVDWANDDYGLLRAAAITALGHSADKRVRALALAKLQQPLRNEHDQDVLRLFIHNYQAGDAKLILDWLAQQTAERAGWHRLCLALIEIARGVADSAECSQLYLYVYEHTPCMDCRHKAMRRLNRLNALTADMLNECLLDASEEIRVQANYIAHPSL